MQNSYKLSRIFCVLASVSVAATVLWLTARPANAEDAQPEAVISAAPPAAAEASNMAASVLKPKPAQNSYKPYFVEFRARSAATYGHMYVIYGKVNGRGEIITSDIAGLHPAGDANNCENCSVIPWTIGHLLFVPSETGASDGDLEEKYVSARYRVMVDADTFKKVSAYIGKLKADTPMWNALLRNCVSFGNNIAENLGLKTPSFVWLEPKDYVEHLRELNGGKPQGALRFAASSLVKTSVSAPPVSLPSRTSSVPRTPKKQPVANSPPSQAIGVASGTTH
jgi:hypothetical protein